jgi:DNA-directed RNA polymerase subunit RPC12/RpoP
VSFCCTCTQKGLLNINIFDMCCGELNAMEKNLSALRVGYEDLGLGGYRCNWCHETFQRPLLAADSSGGRVHVYYACPRCLSKVDVKERRRSEEKAESHTSHAIVEKNRKVVDERAGASCKHFLGYLRKRPKNTPIPDECLTCERMIECLAC